MIRLDGMLMIGAVGANVGKTELACTLIGKLKRDFDFTGVKVTTIKEGDGHCPRGGEGCGVCSAMEGTHVITEETDTSTDKDTARLLRAGAKKVWWLRVVEEELAAGGSCLADAIGSGEVSICESNSLRKVIEPDVFMIVQGTSGAAWKESAVELEPKADVVVTSDGRSFDFDVDRVTLIDGAWGIRHAATAIIMAGGDSSRMGRDKSMMVIDGKTMIERIYRQLEPYFDQVLISSNEPEKYSFLGLDVIPDAERGRGPLMGIACALEASANETNLVVACDIPDVDMRLARGMLREARRCDVVLGRTGQGKVEPLFAVYKKSMLTAMEQTLSAGRNKILDALFDCEVGYVDTEAIVNINTMDDYVEFVEGDK